MCLYPCCEWERKTLESDSWLGFCFRGLLLKKFIAWCWLQQGYWEDKGKQSPLSGFGWAVEESLLFYQPILGCLVISQMVLSNGDWRALWFCSCWSHTAGTGFEPDVVSPVCCSDPPELTFLLLSFLPLSSLPLPDFSCRYQTDTVGSAGWQECQCWWPQAWSRTGVSSINEYCTIV